MTAACRVASASRVLKSRVPGPESRNVIPELGQLALILALLLSALLCVLPIAGAWRDSPPLMATARPRAVGQFVVVALAFAILTYAFLVNDFSVAYVAQNSNLQLPWWYRFSAVWGAHEGSMLLWILILDLWTVAVAALGGRLPQRFHARVLGVLGFVAFGFLLYTITTSNPFARLLPAPANGADLNPVLQDPGLIFHPPVLYMGYVGFSVAFAFAIAALLGGEMQPTWVRWSRAARGHTTNSAGAAGGSGIRWRTPASCRGWWAPRWSTRRPSPTSAAACARGRCSCRSSPSRCRCWAPSWCARGC